MRPRDVLQEYRLKYMKKQAETLDSKEGRQNIFRIGKQKKKERKDITGTNCLKGDNGELVVSEEQVLEPHSSTSPLPLYMGTSSLICQLSGIASSFTILL